VPLDDHDGDDVELALTREQVMRARALDTTTAPVVANGAATTTATMANGADAPGACSECGQPTPPGRYTCSTACADTRKRRRAGERSRAARSNRQPLGARERPANVAMASVPPEVVSSPQDGAGQALGGDWRRLANVVGALTAVGLRVALTVGAVEVVVSNA
jgi:hypothetical protein